MAITPECNPAAEVQGPGPNSGDGNPIDVNVLTLPPVVIPGCVKVEDCPAGVPVRINIVASISLPVNDNGGSLTIDGSVAVTNFPAVQPVSGIVTANQGAPAVKTLANSWPVSQSFTQGSLVPATISNSSSAPNIPIDQTGNQTQVVTLPMIYTGFTGASAFWERRHSPSKFNTAQAVAAGNTVLWTPAAGRKFRLMRYMVEITGNASIAGAGAVVTVSLFDGAAGATGQAHDVFVPLAALAGIGLLTTGWIDLGNGYPSVLANNVLNINLSAALVTGNCRVICCGTEE